MSDIEDIELPDDNSDMDINASDSDSDFMVGLSESENESDSEIGSAGSDSEDDVPLAALQAVNRKGWKYILDPFSDTKGSQFCSIISACTMKLAIRKRFICTNRFSAFFFFAV